VALWDAEFQGKGGGRGRVERDGDLAMPRVVGRLRDCHGGAAELVDHHPAADVKVHIQLVGTARVEPRRQAQQGARNVTDTARAVVPWVARFG